MQGGKEKKANKKKAASRIRPPPATQQTTVLPNEKHKMQGQPSNPQPPPAVETDSDYIEMCAECAELQAEELEVLEAIYDSAYSLVSPGSLYLVS